MNMKTKQFITKNFIFVLAVLLLMAFTGCKKTYEVKFDSAGGSSVETQEIKKNGTVTKPANPTKEGYEFENWLLDGTAYDFNAKVTSSFTLVASWKEVVNPQKATIEITSDKDVMEYNGSIKFEVTVTNANNNAYTLSTNYDDLVQIENNVLTLKTEITLDKFVTVTATLTEDPTVKASKSITIKAPIVEGQVGELTSDMLKEIGNQSITVTGVLTDYYRDFKNSANNSTNAYDMVVKMNDGVWYGEWNHQLAVDNKMVDYYRRSEKDGYRDSYGNVGHALERLYINKNNELASAIEKNYNSFPVLWEQQHLWNHLANLHGDDGLAGLLIGVGLEGGVLLGQLGQGDAHLLVAGLGLGLDGHADDRLGELHRLKDDGVVLIAQGVAGGGVLQAHDGGDIACVAAVDVLAVVGVHLEDAAHTLAAVLHRVVNGGASLDLTGVNAEVCQLADEGVGRNLEGQSSKGSVVGRGTSLGLLGLRIDALDVLDIGGGGHVVHDGVQQLLNALVLVGRAADHGHQGVGDGLLADGGLQLLAGDLLALEVLLHQLLIVLGDSLDEDVVVLLGLLLHVLGDLLEAHVVAHIVVVDLSLHIDQVDDALKGVFLADGQLDRHAVGVQTVVQHLDAAEEVGAHGIHLVDVNHTGDLVLVRLAPDSLGLGLNAALRGQNGDRTVQNAQRALDLDGEVDVARGVDDVDTMTALLVGDGIVLQLGVAPVAGGCSGGDGDTTLLLLHHPVHGSGAFVHLADLMGDAGVVQNALGGGGLAGIDVRHDADISGHLKRNFSGSSHEINLLQINNGNERKPCWPRPSYGYPRASSRRCRCCWQRP